MHFEEIVYDSISYNEQNKDQVEHECRTQQGITIAYVKLQDVFMKQQYPPRPTAFNCMVIYVACKEATQQEAKPVSAKA